MQIFTNRLDGPPEINYFIAHKGHSCPFSKEKGLLLGKNDYNYTQNMGR